MRGKEGSGVERERGEVLGGEEKVVEKREVGKFDGRGRGKWWGRRR